MKVIWFRIVFFDSGSTLVAAKRLRRDFLGTEIDKNFYKISYEKISREK